MLTTNDTMITQQPLGTPLIGSVLINLERALKPEQTRQSPSMIEPEKRSACLQDNPQHRDRLTSLLLICFDTLDTFGKEPEQLVNLEKAFQMMLGKFTINQVEEAFKIYMKSNTVMPKPADIIKIIEPPAEARKWCGATFIDIKRRMRENQFITNAEKQYCEDFIAARIKAPEQQKGIFEDAIMQVEQQNRQYYAIE